MFFDETKAGSVTLNARATYALRAGITELRLSHDELSKSMKVWNMKLPTLGEIERAATKRGGYTREQLAEWGVPWPPPKGWKKALQKLAKSQI